MKYNNYNIISPSFKIQGNVKASENPDSQKEPVMNVEEFFKWVSQHIEFHTEAYKALEDLGLSEEDHTFLIVQPRTFSEPFDRVCESCENVIMDRKPCFQLDIEAFGCEDNQSIHLCPSCFPRLIDECDKTLKQLRTEIKVKENE